METRADVRALSDAELEDLVMGPLQEQVKGIGATLARYLLILLGLEAHIKPDIMIHRFFDSLSPWRPRVGDERDIELMR